MRQGSASSALRVLIAMAALCATTAGADDTAVRGPGFQLLGPLPFRDLTPFDLLRLDMPPASAAWETGPGWGFQFQHQHANTFLVSFNVEEFLLERGERTPVTEEDLEIIYSLDGDVFYIDGEVGIVDLTTSFFFDDRWSLYLTVPVQYYNGGVFDSPIESFHDSFDLSQSGRDLVATDQFQIVIDTEEGRFAALETRRNAGVADPFLGVRRRFRMGPRWESVLEAAVKVPVADEEALFSSGEFDFGLQYTLQRKFGRNGLYLALTHVWSGENQLLGDNTDRTIPKASFTWELGATPRTSILFQWSIAESMLAGSDVSDLTKPKFFTALGIRHRRGHVIFDLGLIENFENQGNSFDVGIYWGIGFLSGLG